MARMIDPMPEWKGEAKTWSSLQSFFSDSVVVYHNREVNGKEFDFCLFFENWFIVMIEVKGWECGRFRVIDANHVRVDGYAEPVGSPKKQAKEYRIELLNKILRKYGAAPLIMDLVCYPFITKTEYLQERLDLFSEEAFTIFREELEDRALFLKKLGACYDRMKAIQHADFTPEFMLKLRSDWEPNLNVEPAEAPEAARPYSELSVFRSGIRLKTAKRAIEAYFGGTKQVLFVGDEEDYRILAGEFDAAFRERNIEPGSGSLSPGYSKGLAIGDRFARTFNLEIYHSERLGDVCDGDVTMVEGPARDADAQLLCRLGEITPFNAEQFLVEHARVDENTMVQAGAGTGKTYAMVSRVAFLCNKLRRPVDELTEEIALLTFTNDAANNMKIRLKRMFVNYFVQTGNSRYLKFVEDTDRAQISTIHSFAGSILRDASIYTGLGTNFKLTTDQHLREEIYNARMNAWIERVVEERPNFINEIPVPVYELRKKLIVLADKLLDKSVDLSAIRPSALGVPANGNIPFFNELIREVLIPAETEYLESLHQRNCMDMKELIIQLGVVLARMGERKLARLKYRFLFIDEFQDTDDEQIRIFCWIQRAMSVECRLFVVGDLKQSIYRFRGAKLSAFKLLRKSSEGRWGRYSLTINYRTDHRLLEAYEGIFARMAERNLLPYRPESDRLTSTIETGRTDPAYQCLPVHGRDAQKFADALVGVLREEERRLAELMRSAPLNRNERTIAILVRMNYQVEQVVRIARNQGIRMETKSGGDLFQLQPVHDLYKLMLALTNSASVVHLVNLIESNYTDLRPEYWKLHGLSDSERLFCVEGALDALFLQRMGLTWAQVVEQAYTQPVLFVMKNIYDALQPWRQYSFNEDEQYFYTINYEYLLEKMTENARIETLTLTQAADYLRINILTSQQRMARNPEAKDEGIRFICTTVHKAKGLEYGTVILPFAADSILDDQKAQTDASYMDGKLAYIATFSNRLCEHNSNFKSDEERGEQVCDEARVLYVALTRAIGKFVWFKDVDRERAISWQKLLEV